MQNNIFQSQEADQLVLKNRFTIRQLESKYFQNEYDKMISEKNEEKKIQQRQKNAEHSVIDSLNKNYHNEVNTGRMKSLNQQNLMANQYEDFIKQKKEKERYDKNLNIKLQQSTIEAPTWIRDVFQQRQTYKKNINFYGKELDNYVKDRDARKRIEQQQEKMYDEKIRNQARQLEAKEDRYVNARHKQKSLFEKRQNQLLGASMNNPDPEIGSSGLHQKDTILKRQQQSLYSKGLQIQLKREQQKKRHSLDKLPEINNSVYNPIINPLPYVYKNPNVLRMMAQR